MKFSIHPISSVAQANNQNNQSNQQSKSRSERQVDLSTDRQVQKVEKELTTTISLLPARKGIHDKPVEVFVNGEIKETFLSQVQVGQPWHALEGNFSNKWFVCLSPVKLDYSRDAKNPTLIMGAMNVLQADSMESRIYRPARLPSKVSASDVEDVEVVERR